MPAALRCRAQLFLVSKPMQLLKRTYRPLFHWSQEHSNQLPRLTGCQENGNTSVVHYSTRKIRSPNGKHNVLKRAFCFQKYNSGSFTALLKGPSVHAVRGFGRIHREPHPKRIDGTLIAQEIQDEIKSEVQKFVEAGNRIPLLAVLLIGSDPASVVYVRNKARAARYTGIACDVLRLPDTVTEQEVLLQIKFLNESPEVDGILVQLPLPAHISERIVCDTVAPEKDVDGFNVLNIGRFCVDQDAFIPATPSGVLEIIRRLNINTFGKNAVVVGRSKNVGLPIAMHLHSDRNGRNHAGDATTTICHRNTPPEQLKMFSQQADLLVTATGVPGLITSDMVKEGAVVIDVGITRVLDNKGKAKLVGDVDYAGVLERARLITPVPGGVGPVTVAMVIKNTLIAFKNRLGLTR